MYGLFNMRLLKIRLLKERLLNIRGVECEIVEENWLKWSVVELKYC